MATLYANPAHEASSLERVDLAHRLDPELEKYRVDMETISNDSSLDRVNIFVVFVFILEILVLIFVAVLEYFLRNTEVFPVRHLNFSCLDEDISYTTTGSTYRDFAYHADVSYEVVVALCFCIPPFIMMIGEIALWAFTEEEQKIIRVMCHQCKMPQVLRRVIRYIGAFLFGLLVTMIFTDVVKILIGRLRPNFIETCRPNTTICGNGGLFDEDICLERDLDKIREARLSFPSLHASMTAFASCYMAIYLHNTIRAHSVRIMKPFISLAFIMLSVLCCLARYGLRYSHWTDVMVGFGLGIIIAVYISVFVLNNFREYMTSEQLYLRLRMFLAEQRALELRDLYKEDKLERYSYFGIPAYGSSNIDAYLFNGGMNIPRPQTRGSNMEPQLSPFIGDPGESSTNPIYDKAIRTRQDTFQRDLTRTLDQYRRDTYNGGYTPGHI